MLRFLLILAGLIVTIVPVFAQIMEQKAQPIDRQVKDGFVVIALITKDENWKEKWLSPPSKPPEFKGAYELAIGEKAYILTFFAGAQAINGEVILYCDIKTISPSGREKQYPANLCYKNAKTPKPNYLHMVGLDIGFTRTKEDEIGLHKFEIGVEDKARQIRVPVMVSIKYADENIGK